MFSLIQQNPYLSLLISTIIEWPITTFVSAGLAAHHILRIEYVVIITILGDVIGDIWLFLGGRYCFRLGIIQRLIHRIPKRDQLAQSLKKNPLLYLMIAKVTPYLAAPTLSFLGTQKHMTLVKFIWYSVIISTLVKIIYLSLWYLGAVSVQQLESLLSWRGKVMLYLIVWAVSFWWANIIYNYVGMVLRKRIKNK